MLLTFLGAAHEVTGSCFYLRTGSKQILIDCGMQQGPDEYENQEFPLDAAQIDLVLLTHAHIDHSGRLPLLYAKGFRGAIHTTGATCDLCDIMLRDSAHIQMFEAEWRNRKAKRSGKKEYIPLYNMQDAIGTIESFVPHAYGEMVEVCDGVRARFIDAGHLLGSASIELWVEDEGQTRKLVFSGDIGNLNQPLLRDPSYMTEADYVVMESTYGDRSHSAPPDYAVALAKVIQTTFDRGGNVIIPSFAVGRTQEMLYFLRQIQADGLVKGHKDFSVYVDSPLANEATQVFTENRAAYFDEQALELIRNGINPIGFKGLTTAVSSDESRAINHDKKCKVILSASGMCEAGRIKHHLKHNLWRPECTVVFVGYQAQGTLGRALMEGARTVKLFGEEIEVKAQILKLEGVSGHADREGLVRWVESFVPKAAHVFVVHGDNTVCESFANLLQDTHDIQATAPLRDAAWDLLSGKCVCEGQNVRQVWAATSASVRPVRVSDVYVRLLAAGKRLLSIITRNEGSANKDLAKFTDQINALCEKYNR